jgi:hypothetical protein
MDCKNARLLLDFARPQGTELDTCEAEALESHLADCPECGCAAQNERRLDDHIGRAMRAVPVPEDLRGRLLRRLAVERDAWYRRWLLRGAGAVAAAAAIVLLVWSWLLVKGSFPPTFDPSEVSVDRSSVSPRAVEDWFRTTHGIKTVAPSDGLFRYTKLTYYGMEELQGKRVPMLLFTANDGHNLPARAQVYIVTDKQFDGLEELVNQPRKITGGYTVEVLRNQDRPDVYYVMVYTDGSREVFFKKRPIAT